MSNLGKYDRIIRVVLGLALYMWMLHSRNYIGLLGFVLLLSAGISYCPLYHLLHFSTAPRNTRRAELAHHH